MLFLMVFYRYYFWKL